MYHLCTNEDVSLVYKVSQMEPLVKISAEDIVMHFN